MQLTGRRLWKPDSVESLHATRSGVSELQHQTGFSSSSARARACVVDKPARFAATTAGGRRWPTLAADAAIAFPHNAAMSGELIQQLRRLEGGFSALCASQADADALFREAKHFSTVAESGAVLPEATRCRSQEASSTGWRRLRRLAC